MDVTKINKPLSFWGGVKAIAAFLAISCVVLPVVIYFSDKKKESESKSRSVVSQGVAEDIKWSAPIMSALVGDWQCGNSGAGDWTFLSDGRASLRVDPNPDGPIAMARWPNRIFFQYSIAGDEIRLREIYQILKPFASDYNEVNSAVASEILIEIGNGFLTAVNPPDIQLVDRVKIDDDRLRMQLVSYVSKGIESVDHPHDEQICTRTLSMDHGPIDPTFVPR